MANESETALPGSVMTPSQVRKLKIAIAIMSVMLVAGFILLIVGIYFESQKLATKADDAVSPARAAGEPAIHDLAAPAGAEIRQLLVDSGRLILHLAQPGGGEIAILDLKTGREIRRIRLTPAKSP